NGAKRVAAKATGLRLAGDRLIAVVTESGEIACDAAVVAAGARSKQLTASIGDPLPLETERGYHVMIENPESGPRSSMMASDAKMVVNWTDKGLRAAGTVEIAGLDAEPNWKRAEILREHLLGMFPKLPRDIPPSRIKTWFGHRPSMPDGRPCIGHARARATWSMLSATAMSAWSARLAPAGWSRSSSAARHPKFRFSRSRRHVFYRKKPQLSPAQAVITAGAITRLGICGLIVPALTSCV
ncbi:FAD-dependent oxidoreductase, partial [Bradyrhizobium sp. 10BB]